MSISTVEVIDVAAAEARLASLYEQVGDVERFKSQEQDSRWTLRRQRSTTNYETSSSCSVVTEQSALRHQAGKVCG